MTSETLSSNACLNWADICGVNYAQVLRETFPRDILGIVPSNVDINPHFCFKAIQALNNQPIAAFKRRDSP
jgi:hypothetical protein